MKKVFYSIFTFRYFRSKLHTIAKEGKPVPLQCSRKLNELLLSFQLKWTFSNRMNCTFLMPNNIDNVVGKFRTIFSIPWKTNLFQSRWENEIYTVFYYEKYNVSENITLLHHSLVKKRLFRSILYDDPWKSDCSSLKIVFLGNSFNDGQSKILLRREGGANQFSEIFSEETEISREERKTDSTMTCTL